MINKWAICCNKQVAFLQGAKFALWSWCGSLRPAPYMLYPFVGWTRGVLPISIFKWSKRPLDSGGGRCDHHHFYLSEQCFGTISKKYRHCSEQYQRNTDIIPKLFDIVPKVNIRFIRSALGTYFDFRLQKAIKIRWKFAPFTEYSLFKCSFCALDQ